jgi:phenylpyruvate tautomerase PptA (4-oxalocrotonate tautomerase family)
VPLSRLNTQTAKKGKNVPLLNFTVVAGRTPQEIRQLLDSAHAAVVEAFGVPNRDRYQIVNVREPDQVIALDTGLDIERSDRLVIIEVTSRQRTDAQKQRFFELLAEKLQRDCGLDPKNLIVSITENHNADWSFGKGRAQFLTGELT